MQDLWEEAKAQAQREAQAKRCLFAPSFLSTKRYVQALVCLVANGRPRIGFGCYRMAVSVSSWSLWPPPVSVHVSLRLHLSALVSVCLRVPTPACA